MTRPGQLALDFGHRPALGREDFLVAPCNEDAVAWVDRWPDWPGPALVIHGPAGCGKTHLAQVWRRRSGVPEASVVEGNFVTPKLVGDRVGLHPVWMIFALLAGGALFGFVGVLLSVPAAATIGVLLRFGLERYLASPLYGDGEDGDDEDRDGDGEAS